MGEKYIIFKADEFEQWRDGMLAGNAEDYWMATNMPKSVEIESESIDVLKTENERFRNTLTRIVNLGIHFDAKGVHSEHVVALARAALKGN